MVNLQQETQSLRALHQANRATLGGHRPSDPLGEQDNRLSNLQQKLVQKDKFFVDEVEVYKDEVAQALLVDTRLLSSKPLASTRAWTSLSWDQAKESWTGNL
ncbi:hypothetical protein ACSQ67_003063 [Phaseolus vulgaris]